MEQGSLDWMLARLDDQRRRRLAEIEAHHRQAVAAIRSLYGSGVSAEEVIAPLLEPVGEPAAASSADAPRAAEGEATSTRRRRTNVPVKEWTEKALPAFAGREFKTADMVEELETRHPESTFEPSAVATALRRIAESSAVVSRRKEGREVIYGYRVKLTDLLAAQEKNHDEQMAA